MHNNYPCLTLQVSNTGTVYVFQNVKTSHSFLLKAVALDLKSSEIAAEIKMKMPATLTRQVPLTDGSRYGNALINLGKLKDDGFGREAFAVGSPYEDEGKGAIHIYFGSANFWKDEGLNSGT